MTFDMGTAVFFIGLQAVLAALALLVAWRIHYQERAAAYWALGYCTMALGLVSYLMRGAWPSPAVIIVGNSMVVAGHLLLNRAFAAFVGRSSPWRLFVLVSLGALLGNTYWTLIEPNVTARLVLMIIGMMLSCALIVRDLLIGREAGRHIARLALAAFYTLHLGIGALHVVLTLTGEALPNFLAGTELQKAWMVWNTAVLYLVPVGIVLMTGERLLDRLDRLASRDELTGLLNRRAFNQRLAEEHSRARRAGQPIAVLMLDLDHFKMLNDSHGHAAGDVVLQALTWTTDGILRREDIFARLGGEEFCVLLPGTNGAGAMLVAERIRTAIEGLRVPYGTETLTLTASIGVAIVGPRDSDPAITLQAADAALYRAKDRGRNTVVMAESLVPVSGPDLRPARTARA